MGEDFQVDPKLLEQIASQVLQDIERADSHYESEVEPKVIQRRQSYESEPEYYEKVFPKLSKISKLTSSDVADTIEWALPGLLRIFFGGEDVVTLQGVNDKQDMESAAIMQELINYQLQRHNHSFIVFHDWFKSALIENVGIVKCYWERQEKVEESYEIYVNQQELQALQQQPSIKILVIEQRDTDLFRVEYDVISLVKNQPVVENIPVSELRYSPDAKDIDTAEFVAHRKMVTADYLRRRQRDGIYNNVEKAIEESNTVQYTQYDQLQNPTLNNMPHDDTINEIDKARRKMYLYECYTKIDVNEDGLLEDVIVTMVGKTILRIQENTMGRHPFFLLSPIRDPFRIWAKKGLCDLVSQLQDLKTALLRQIIYNVAISNDKQAFVNVDTLVDVREFIEGKKAVRVQGDPRQAVFWTPIEPLPPQVFQFLEYVDTMKENRTGITRYNQGMDASTLNKTASGVNQIMNASQQRLELIARMFAETGVNQLFRHLIRLNQAFIDNEVVIRVTNKPKLVRHDDLQGEIDIIVNAGMGTGSKQVNIQNIQMLLSLYPQMLQAGIAAPFHVAYVIGKLIEEMGWKNKEDFAFTPEQVMENMQNQQPEEPEKKPPNISINANLLPPDGLAQALALAGIQVDPNALAEFMQMQDAKEEARQDNLHEHQIGMAMLNQKHQADMTQFNTINQHLLAKKKEKENGRQ